MSRLTRISLLLAGFFTFDKALGLLRAIVLNNQFGFSKEFDAFNAANNIPDLLFTLISGGALAIAFIPVLSQELTQHGRERAWKLFSRIANLAFLVTGGMALLVAAFAGPLVRSELGIAPGFESVQQEMVANIMRLYLVSTVIFSISGLVMAGLQANQHFLLPALAPILHNLGQIFGALILAPEQGATFGPVTLPAFGMGINGLVVGVIIGSLLHLGIQIPGLLRYGFRWSLSLGLRDAAVRQVLRLMGPRLATMLMIQITFLVRDNLASRLGEGSVSALALGYMIVQFPETLIGTAIGTALLPTLSEFVTRQDTEAFRSTLQRALQVIIAITLPVAVVLALGIRPLLQLAFGNLTPVELELLLWVTRGFLVGLAGECLLEVAARSFYARQEAIVPLFAAGLNLLVYIAGGVLLYGVWGAPGISLTAAVALTCQGLLLLFLLNRRLPQRLTTSRETVSTVARAVLAAALGGGIVWLVARLPMALNQPLLVGLAALALGGGIALLPVWKEIRLLGRL